MANPFKMAAMATVELSFTPLPAHVRTARLVATAVARRSGVEESLLDEVRLAVGEACSRAVEAHRLHCPAEPVRIQLSDRDGRFEVVVTDAVPGGVDDAAAMRAALDESAAHAPVPPTGGRASGVHEQGAAGLEAGGAGTAAPGTAAPGTAAHGTAAHGTAHGIGTPGADGAGGRAANDVAGSGPDTAAGPMASGTGGTTGANGGLPAGIGLAVIAGLADDVHISATGDGVSVRMSWPLGDPR